MAFVRKKTKVYPWPVEIKTPSETNIGEFETTTHDTLGKNKVSFKDVLEESLKLLA